MKYLTYILSERPVNPQSLIIEQRGLRQLTAIAVLPSTIVGLFFVAALTPGAAVMDTARLFRLIAHRRNKRANLRKYATAVIISLGHEPTKDKINLLIAA